MKVGSHLYRKDEIDDIEHQAMFTDVDQNAVGVSCLVIQPVRRKRDVSKSECVSVCAFRRSSFIAQTSPADGIVEAGSCRFEIGYLIYDAPNPESRVRCTYVKIL